MPESTPADIHRSPSSGFEIAPGERRGWSRFGIASLVVGILSAAMLLAALALAIVWKVGHDSRNTERANPHTIIVGLAVIGAWAGLLVGTGLAIVGLFESKRTRGPAVVGVILNGVGVLVVALMLIIGLMMRR